jgi:23S rRNA (uracil1939-C5)-methyltransferase
VLRKNDLAELTITGMTAEGSGVGRVDGAAVFVAASAPGDRLLVRIIKVSKNYAVGRVEKVLEPSPARIPVDCGVFRPCGGCVYRHLSYAEECEIKRRKVQDALQRIGGLDGFVVEPIVAAQETDRYRNKAQLPIGVGADGKLCAGFFAQRSHRIVPCSDCLLQPKEFAVITESFLRWAQQRGLSAYDEESHKGVLRHLCLRQARATGEFMVCIVCNADSFPGEQELADCLRADVPQIKSIVLNVNRERTNVILGPKCRTIWGQDFITDQLGGISFRISPLSFYQVNHDQAERLYTLARQEACLTGVETLLDLYCGTGTIGLFMASGARRVIGAEIVAQAVEDAKQNAARNGIENAEFLCADAAEAVSRLAQRGETPDVVVVDPPRKGCSEDLLHIIAEQMRPRRIVYVSCDPATLARDVKQLGTMGYQLRRATPVDLFPRTCHVETVVLMSRRRD